MSLYGYLSVVTVLRWMGRLVAWGGESEDLPVELAQFCGGRAVSEQDQG
jgi:hypothetical protein